MSIINLKCYRLIPVRPEDWNLLGICWKKQYYIDMYLSISLRSASFLFNQFSTAIQWTIQHKYHVIISSITCTTSLQLGLLPRLMLQ